MTTTADAVIDRLKTFFNVKSDSALCRSLDLPRTTISTWKIRDSVPYSLCVELALTRGLSLDWLLTGEGGMLREKQDKSNDSIGKSKLTPKQQALLGLFDALEEDQQREILTVAEEKKRLNQVEATLEAVLKKLA